MFYLLLKSYSWKTLSSTCLLSLHRTGEWVLLAALPGHSVIQAARGLAKRKCQFVLPGSRGQQHTSPATVQSPKCIPSPGIKHSISLQNTSGLKEGNFSDAPTESSGLYSIRWIKRSLSHHRCLSPWCPPALMRTSSPSRSLIILKCSVTGQNECCGTCRRYTAAPNTEPPPPALITWWDW